MSDATVVNFAGPLRNEAKNTDRPTWAALLNTVADVLEGRASDVRVVSADAVVINRDDIPDGLIETLRSGHDPMHGPGDRCPGCDAARLLSGGSPAAPEDGTDG